jgi:hypothetical protein
MTRWRNASKLKVECFSSLGGEVPEVDVVLGSKQRKMWVP